MSADPPIPLGSWVVVLSCSMWSQYIGLVTRVVGYNSRHRQYAVATPNGWWASRSAWSDTTWLGGVPPHRWCLWAGVRPATTEEIQAAQLDQLQAGGL